MNEESEIFLTHPTSATWTPKDLLLEILRMTEGFPTILIFARAWALYLDDDWVAVKADASRESGYVITYPDGVILTVKQRLIKAASSIVGIGYSDKLTGFEVVAYREHCTGR